MHRWHGGQQSRWRHERMQAQVTKSSCSIKRVQKQESCKASQPKQSRSSWTKLSYCRTSPPFTRSTPYCRNKQNNDIQYVINYCQNLPNKRKVAQNKLRKDIQYWQSIAAMQTHISSAVTYCTDTGYEDYCTYSTTYAAASCMTLITTTCYEWLGPSLIHKGKTAYWFITIVSNWKVHRYRIETLKYDRSQTMERFFFSFSNNNEESFKFSGFNTDQQIWLGSHAHTNTHTGFIWFLKFCLLYKLFMFNL